MPGSLVKINVSKPCTENWQKMTPDKVGRFCAQCEKSVVDFTNLSDNEILSLIAKANSGSCGRFKQSQLERVLNHSAGTPASNYTSFIALRYLVLIGFSGFVLIKTAGAQTLQGGQYAIQQSRTVAEKTEWPAGGNPVSGKVVDKTTHIPIEGATVLIKNSSKGAVTNEAGIFQINSPDQFSSDSIVLIISFIGYHSLEKSISMNTYAVNTTFYLEPMDFTMGEVVIAGGYTIRKKKWWQFWKRW